ncbi:hypothetical protein [Rhodococcus opacus]|uniref:hypothetical protein n=1 Tax=Rhodococcus opacus TaxID=37919 RepID=UPI002948CF73|nr:hypothetical protein [Rhodococcus opacus]MDV6247192.1 hypothetical protein [Rhodococcus opacus]
MHYPRPAQHVVPSPKEPVDAACPACASQDVKRYPVQSEGGWFEVVRCQSCLHQLERVKWRLYGPIEFLSDQIESGAR